MTDSVYAALEVLKEKLNSLDTLLDVAINVCDDGSSAALSTILNKATDVSRSIRGEIVAIEAFIFPEEDEEEEEVVENVEDEEEFG